MAIPTDLLNELDNIHDIHSEAYEEFYSPHEGLAFIEQEFEILKSAVYHPTPADEIIRAAAIQLTTVAMRFIIEIYGEP